VLFAYIVICVLCSLFFQDCITCFFFKFIVCKVKVNVNLYSTLSWIHL